MSSERTSELDEFGDFLRKHYHKFAIMGIFGTVTVFLVDYWPGEPGSTSARIGVVASMFLFLLAAGWIATKSFLLIRDSDNYLPTLSELGFGVISLSTLVLIASVMTVLDSFGDVTQLVAELVFGFLVAIFYFRTYLQGFNDDVVDEVRGSYVAPMVGLWISIVLVFVVLRGEVLDLTAGLFGLKWMIFLPLGVALAVSHYVLSEGVLGATRLIEDRDVIMAHPIQRVGSVWRLRTSLSVSLIAVGAVTVYARYIADVTLGPNMGFYRIAGQPTVGFILGHWLVLAALYSPLLLWKPDEPNHQQYRDIVGFVFAVVTVIVALVDIFYVIPQGTHVIPL